ncbi:PAS/PAC/GGDEF-domain-containing protein [Azoarcus olearius]|uniref:sensor domain-containing diguanylate cyclase n=1 Tax=Azoarcus sp. (strain BH72) TaxID=418699 RepID=UPI00080644D3|nr:sensor domain-containing diguanylate cyclase [Azoarcus olearius]ANQ83426.1 PAS/PAC/GGDEF-domain-containing protein [Azoarcus olearius]
MSSQREKLLEAAVAQSFNAVVITDARLDGGGPHIVYVNRAFCEMTGYAAEDLIGQSPRILQGPDTDPEVIDRLRTALRSGSFFEGATVNYRRDGSAYDVEWNISPVRDDGGELSHFVSVQHNISDKMRMRRERDLLAQALNVASDPIIVTDRGGAIVFVNQAFERLTGYPADEMLGRTPAVLRSGAHDAAFYSGLYAALARGRPFRATFTNRRKDGSLFHAEQSIAPLCDGEGEVTHFVSVSKDLTERIERERALQEIASRDPLTGLYNRRAGEQALELQVQAAHAEGTALSLIIGDIDHFKSINDRHGHPAGDRVLAGVGEALRGAVRSRDLAVRWGGEEFVVLVPECGAARALELAERLRSSVAGLQFPAVGRVTMSLGLATLVAGETAAGLVMRADRALYRAKHGGRDRVETAAALD